MMVAVVAGVGAPIEIMEKPESSVKLIEVVLGTVF